LRRVNIKGGVIIKAFGFARVCLKKRRWKFLLAIIITVLVLNIYYLFTIASNQGPWQPHNEKTATVKITGTLATIQNFRRARYDQTGKAKNITWSERQVDLDKLNSVWYGISVFSSPGLAHTFLSFDFADSDPVVISVEARMRPDQQYSPWKGVLDRYHLIYVIADERDIIGVRTHKRSEEVYFMPITASKKRYQKMFIDMIARANSLNRQPEFYNTLTANCTNSIMQETDIPAWQYYLDPRIILSGFSDRVAYQYGMLNTNFSREKIREASRIRIDGFSDDDLDFYSKIRSNYYRQLEASVE